MFYSLFLISYFFNNQINSIPKLLRIGNKEYNYISIPYFRSLISSNLVFSENKFQYKFAKY